jgi:hypothetical protein
MDAVNDDAAKTQLMVSPSDIRNNRHGLSWDNLTKEEQANVEQIWNEYVEK